jgi:hypothetical protein
MTAIMATPVRAPITAPTIVPVLFDFLVEEESAPMGGEEVWEVEEEDVEDVEDVEDCCAVDGAEVAEDEEDSLGTSTLELKLWLPPQAVSTDPV